ncbi:DUF4136 domain-containing protein [Undibacterium sp.]|jgi:hypothetical protein|uniref:DUF4136 domain-containing protein n=1 Tax=Undibacterium sp. TaxID=1914977 RepID=UPI002C634021|nr:DUF4136 domain-containing protein [Undibacterium sp.]HTD05821.1 DUF4136 domain-containing protein [Undibacterium sp.]
MNTNFRSLLLGLATLTLALALGGCASKPDLSHIQDPNVDFHSYRKFAFLPDWPGGEPSLVERNLRAAARNQLERRGYAFDEQAPDVLVNIAAIMEERQDLRVVPGTFPGKDGVASEDYRLGRLGIDLIDAHRREVVWHGTAEGRLSAAMLRDAGAAADKAVEAVFEGFPIKPGARVAATTAR